ncbi:FecCD family ABC transporter permease [Glaciecola petra]|uniref:Iron ABC transporter permease n=1 Tax=Glaciecola petra TaxID=3075602 RepID=A0ABU2ZQE5_9ALTE|nr:iron ABC transporter permease [Aestuariibacter sp. P117]MDT0594635.1 iron ABC transporter permease [Aestuariibacter sp. P117]
MPLSLRYFCVYIFVAIAYLLPSFVLGDIDTELHILKSLKLPVLLTALLVGFAIACASAALQVVLNNPLADPGIIGVSSGASLMAAIFLFLFSSLGVFTQIDIATNSMYWMPLFCFLGACVSGLLIYILAKKIGRSTSSFVLAGIAISTLFSALIAWLYLIAPPQALQSLTFWLMGSLAYTNVNSLAVVAPIIIVASLALLGLATKINALYLGTSEAVLAGIDAKALHGRVFLLVALLVGVSVSIAGSVAFLGLLVPHSIRRLHGHDNQTVLLCSGILGAIVLTLCAFLNEYLFSTHVPLSLLTASLGAPVFLYLLFSTAKR